MPGPVRRWWRSSQAPAGIFGTIVGGSVMVAGDFDTPIPDVALAVVVTLIIYWLAERWSMLLGSQLRGTPLTRHRVFEVFRLGWPMVQAAYFPLLVLVLAAIFGASNDLAVNLALLASILLLVVLGVVAGRHAQLSRWASAWSGLFTGLLGMALILLKALLH
jgi:hypothetical protein